MLKHLAVAWYPEHWDESRWAEDIRLMKENGIDAVRLFEFAWSRMEKANGKFEFAWVHRVMKLLDENDMHVVLCTPAAAPPVWLTQRHPECVRMDEVGHRASHGGRRHYCASSETYRNYCKRIAVRMHKELGKYKNVIAWQVDNELGFNRCFCSSCDERFRESMRRKYRSLKALNEAWGGAFWSIDFWDWEHLHVPRGTDPEANPNTSPEMCQAACQFYSDTIIDFMEEQIKALRDAGCKLPISTNMMANFDEVDYWEMAKHVDFVGWDNYTFLHTLASNSFACNLMRSLKNGQPTWTFENGVETYPGFNIVQALSSIAHGEEVHTLFRWRSCAFAHEMDLQGLVDWGGTPTEKLAEIKELTGILESLQHIELPPVTCNVAMIFSYQNYWATNKYYGSYWSETTDFYQALFDFGYICDMVEPTADLSKYDLVLAPGLSLVGDDALENIRDYVKNGGVLLAGRKTFCKTDSASFRQSVHPALPDMFGARVVETMSAEDRCDVMHSIYRPPFPELSYQLRGKALNRARTEGWFEVLETSTARTISTYAEGMFKNRPAVCENTFGNGLAIYCGVKTAREGLRGLVARALRAGGIRDLVEVPQGLQLVRRGDIWIITNHTWEALSIQLPRQGKTLAGAPLYRKQVTLPGFNYSIVEMNSTKAK